MGSKPWKDAYVLRLLNNFDGERVTVKTPGIVYGENESGGLSPVPERELSGRLLGEESKGSLRCLIVNVAPVELWARWHAAPDAAARKALDVFTHDRWVALVRGVDVEGMVAGA